VVPSTPVTHGEEASAPVTATAAGSGGLLVLPTLAGTASLGGSADWFNSNKVATTRHPVKRREVTLGFLGICRFGFEGRIHWKETEYLLGVISEREG
jgi:hypothetical protein